MYLKRIFSFLLFQFCASLVAQHSAPPQFQGAFDELTAMLEGTQPLDYERAVFITENAFHDNQYTYEAYRSSLDLHSAIIERLMQANLATPDASGWQRFKKTSLGIPLETDAETQEKYRKALANWAIFTYLTDTLQFKLDSATFNHLPFTYTTEDPFGSNHWQNTQTLSLLETQRGNCYALAVLFKLLADRFAADADLVTAPNHIYIQHRDPKGDLFNVELATRSFPGTGTIQTLTYTTREAQLNNLALRSLDIKQSVALCLVYLAKGYEHRYGTPNDDFVLACADKALEHDANNLNALLLKAQVLEQRVMTQQMPATEYEALLADLYKRGYRQMPDDMQAIVLAAIEDTPVAPTENKTPNPFENIGADARYVTLSHGAFDELHKPQKQVLYGQTVFDTEESKVVEFNNAEAILSQFDPVVFALSVDPLMKSYPMLTPYQFASNRPIDGIDLDGLEFFPVELLIKGSAWYAKLKNGTKDLVQSATNTGSYVNPNVPKHVQSQTRLLQAGHGANAVKESLVEAGEITAEAINTIPGVDVVGDPLLAIYFGSKGDYESAAAYATAVAAPGVSGLVLKGAGKGLKYVLKNTDLDLRSSGVVFRDALEAAFEKTGISKDQFKVTKWGKDKYGKDVPVEFKAEGGAKVSIDFAHTTNGPDAPHIGWQTGGKGKDQSSGHIILDDVPAGRSSDKLDKSQN